MDNENEETNEWNNYINNLEDDDFNNNGKPPKDESHTKEPLAIDDDKEVKLSETIALTTSAKANLLDKCGFENGIKEQYEYLSERCAHKSDYVKDCKDHLKNLLDEKSINSLIVVQRGIALSPKKIIKNIQARKEKRILKRQIRRAKREIVREQKDLKKLLEKKREMKKNIQKEFKENKAEIDKISKEQLMDRFERRREKLKELGIIVGDVASMTKEQIAAFLAKAKDKEKQAQKEDQKENQNGEGR